LSASLTAFDTVTATVGATASLTAFDTATAPTATARAPRHRWRLTDESVRHHGSNASSPHTMADATPIPQR